MDLLQVGKFIAALRAEHKLTQEQLGEKIGVTNKTVSRWENGKYLPPADVLLSMSQLFDVSINEILSGKRLPPEAYREAAEANLTQTLRESSFSLKEQVAFYKAKWLKEHFLSMILMGICIVAVLLFGIVCRVEWLIAVAMLLLLAAHCWRNNTMMAYVEKHVYGGGETR